MIDKWKQFAHPPECQKFHGVSSPTLRHSAGPAQDLAATGEPHPGSLRGLEAYFGAPVTPARFTQALRVCYAETEPLLADYTSHCIERFVSEFPGVGLYICPGEALQLEYSWIKEYEPRFNVRYRDDKSYPYLAVELNEEFPRLRVYRGEKRSGVRYFGPFVHVWAIRETLDLLLRVFPARTCAPKTSRSPWRKKTT